MAIHVLLFDLHIRTVPQDPFNHGRDLRGRAALELGVDTDRFFLHMPVDHHTPTAVPDVPLGHEILIPRAELFGVRGARGGAFPPNLWASDGKGGIGDAGNGLA